MASFGQKNPIFFCKMDFDVCTCVCVCARACMFVCVCVFAYACVLASVHEMSVSMPNVLNMQKKKNLTVLTHL